MKTDELKQIEKEWSVAMRQAGIAYAGIALKIDFDYVCVITDESQNPRGIISLTDSDLYYFDIATLIDLEVEELGSALMPEDLNRIERSLIMTYAGGLAENKFLNGTTGECYIQDKVLNDSESLLGMLIAGSKKKKAYHEALLSKAIKLVNNNWIKIEKLSEALLKNEFLCRNYVKLICH